MKDQKKALKNITYGVYIIASKFDNKYSAATITWVSQASLKPALIMVGLKRSSTTYQIVINSKKFSVNILNESQKNMASSFFKNTVFENNKINGFDFFEGSSGVPIFSDVNSFFECKVIKVVEGGDHDIIVGEIQNSEIMSEERPLILRSTGWSYT